MQVNFAPRLVFLALAGLCLSACSSLDGTSGRVAGLITPYRAEVVQGNFISKEQKEALQIGMPRAQVKDILGSPLVTSAFHADRWDFVFTIRRQSAQPQQRRLSVFFKGDELAKVESDELISEEEFVTSLSAGRTLGKVPVLVIPTDKLPAPVRADPATNASSTASGSAPARVYPPLESAVR